MADVVSIRFPDALDRHYPGAIVSPRLYRSLVRQYLADGLITRAQAEARLPNEGWKTRLTTARCDGCHPEDRAWQDWLAYPTAMFRE